MIFYSIVFYLCYSYEFSTIELTHLSSKYFLNICSYETV